MIVDNLVIGIYREAMAKFRQNIPASRRNPAKAVSPSEAVEVVIEVFPFCFALFHK